MTNLLVDLCLLAIVACCMTFGTIVTLALVFTTSIIVILLSLPIIVLNIVEKNWQYHVRYPEFKDISYIKD